MADWIPDDLRRATTYGCLLLLSSEAVYIHATQHTWPSAPYLLPSTAADYEQVHIEREDFAPNGWAAQRISASDSSSGAMLAGDNSPAGWLHGLLETSGYFLLVNPDSGAIKR